MAQKKTTATVTKEPKATKKQTLGEFRAWLSGVEEMQSEDWSPDLTEWRRIRQRIDEIVESRPPRNTEDDGPPIRYPSFVPPSNLMPEQPIMPQPIPPTPPPFMNTSGVEGARIKTPNVDTSAGTYASSLE